MDVKLESTQWHRITEQEIRAVSSSEGSNKTTAAPSVQQIAEKKKVLLQSKECDTTESE